MSISEITTNSESRMQKAIDNLRREYGTLRAGRATPSLLERVMVDYYGTPTPVNQVANISIPEPRMILVKPWEKTMLGPIEKAIQKSDLGITPNNDGEAIRLNIPQLTNERRKELCKVVNKKAEENRVAVRNIRRDANDAIKKLEKDKTITEDDSKKAVENVQKMTDKYIKEVDTIMASKEKEIMEV
ncbi:ribosome recycling factor [Selenomonadales bacterium OttesenSCG-928-I06]|nr:ribosome recycling factor [Selenomonadales bacterium OttesenSCG-928-I06]